MIPSLSLSLSAPSLPLCTHTRTHTHSYSWVVHDKLLTCVSKEKIEHYFRRNWFQPINLTYCHSCVYWSLLGYSGRGASRQRNYDFLRNKWRPRNTPTLILEKAFWWTVVAKFWCVSLWTATCTTLFWWSYYSTKFSSKFWWITTTKCGSSIRRSVIVVRDTRGQK